MAKKEKDEKDEEVKTVKDASEMQNTEFIVPKDAVIDVSVAVISLDGDPYHKTGEEFKMAKKTADLRVSQGWVKLKEEKK